MYKINSKIDGYIVFDFFLLKLNLKCELLFQYFKRNWKLCDNVWYENRLFGVNKFLIMMKDISFVVGFFCIYINYLVRVIVIILWVNVGFINWEIMVIFGYCNEFSF